MSLPVWIGRFSDWLGLAYCLDRKRLEWETIAPVPTPIYQKARICHLQCH